MSLTFSTDQPYPYYFKYDFAYKEPTKGRIWFLITFPEEPGVDQRLCTRNHIQSGPSLMQTGLQ